MFGIGSEEALRLLENCTSFREFRQIHGKIIRSEVLSGEGDKQQALLRKLIEVCSSHGQVEYASLVFHHQPITTTFTWNVMMRALNSTSALLLFQLMLSRGLAPDNFTFPLLIKACTVSSAIRPGQLLHALAIKTRFAGDIFVQNTLMDLYFKCGHTRCGRRLFDRMRSRNVVSWTTMVRGLVDGGDLPAARSLFDEMPNKNVVSWTVIIAGHVKHHQHQEAFKLFARMQRANVGANEFTLVSLVRACTELGSLELGRWVDDFAAQKGVKLEVFLGTALIDMYSKCGSLEDSRRVFKKMKRRSLATWNCMITSLGVHGFGEEALSLFREMEEDSNVEPDGITFVGVLCACLQTNDLDAASYYFERMNQHYRITPTHEHHTYITNMYNRAGTLSQTP